MTSHGLVNHHNYDHAPSRRKVQVAPGVRMFPTASSRNGKRISIGPGTHLGDGCALWTGNALGVIYSIGKIPLKPVCKWPTR
jgi:hypothetical protein